MSAHQVGPWEATHVEYGSETTEDWMILGPAPFFRDIAHITTCYSSDRNPAMEEAHAHLIAAAPGMLELLQQFKRFSESTGFIYPLGSLQQLTEIIAKATGAAA